MSNFNIASALKRIPFVKHTLVYDGNTYKISSAEVIQLQTDVVIGRIDSSLILFKQTASKKFDAQVRMLSNGQLTGNLFRFDLETVLQTELLYAQKYEEDNK
jgi:hypothetical protein